MHPWVVERIPWDTNYWIIDHDAKEIQLSYPQGATGEDRLALQNRVIAETLAAAREGKQFKVLRGWRNELYPIYGSRHGTVGIERAGSGLFGILTFGVHLTAYIEGKDGIQIWVPRRAKDKATYPGKLDNTVAGGMALGETPLETIIRESTEEASLPEDLVRSNIKAAGTVSYFYIQDPREGEESGLLQPSVRYVYDLKVDSNVVPEPGDSEVEGYSLWALDDVKKALEDGEFRPSSTVVLLDFFIRHNILNAENEKDYQEICSRIHRKLPFSIHENRFRLVPYDKRIPLPDLPGIFEPARKVRARPKAKKQTTPASPRKIATRSTKTKRPARGRRSSPKLDPTPEKDAAPSTKRARKR
jgi:isopentenyldiphosphate isomerase